MSITLSDQDKRTLRTAAYGAVTLMSFAGAAGVPHKVAINGTFALSSATGTVGHVLAEKTKDVKLNSKSGAALADQVLPALTESMSLLKKQDPAEAATSAAPSSSPSKQPPGPATASPAPRWPRWPARSLKPSMPREPVASTHAQTDTEKGRYG